MAVRILLFGSALGSHRARDLIYFVSSKFNYSALHVDPSVFGSRDRKYVSRLIGFGIRRVDRILGLHRFVLADIVYILPMASPSRVELWLAKLFGARIVGEFYISRYDTAVNDRQTCRENTWRADALMKADRRFLDSCDHVVFLNDAERKYYLSLIDRKGAVDKTSVIPLCSPKNQEAKLPYAHGQTQCLSLVWWGTYIPLHGLEKIIAAMAVLKARNLDCNLSIFGAGSASADSYRGLTEKLGVHELVSFHQGVTFSDGSLQRILIEGADVAFGNFGESAKARTVLVNKIVEAASFGLPIISQRTEAAGEFFTDEKDIVFAEARAEDIAEKVIRLANDPKLSIALGKNARVLHGEVFSRSNYINKVRAVLEMVEAA